MDKNALISCFHDTQNFLINGPLQRKTILAQQSNKVYPEGFKSFKTPVPQTARITVCKGTSFATARQYISHGRTAVLNFANPHRPGGGVTNGAMAQEECLCRSSNLYPCLTAANVATEYYAYNKRIKHYFFSDRLIYTRGITVFKTDDPVPQMLPAHEWFDVDVITCAAPYVAKRKYTNQAALLDLFKNRIRNIFEAALDNDVKVLILGAFGCGAFKNPPKLVAQAFNEVIKEIRYASAFKQIVFAIKPTTNFSRLNPSADQNPCPNLTAFQLEFDGISPELDAFMPFDSEPAAHAYSCIVMPSGRVFAARKECAHYRNWQQTNPYSGKQFSILGDSVSTLEGYNPGNYKVFYQGETTKLTDVSEMKDTWWGKVIDFFGAELLVNNSWSGSRVTMMPNGSSDRLFPAGVSNERTAGLHIGNVKPDVILVNMGINDWANGVSVDPVKDECTVDAYYRSFSSAYEDMLVKLKKNYPQSEIWCCTLGTTSISRNSSFEFPRSYKGIDIGIYNEAIRISARRHGCNVIELRVSYDTLDGTHPSAVGMNTIAAMVIRRMNPDAATEFMECKEDNHDYIMTGPTDAYDFYTCRKCGKEKQNCPSEVFEDSDALLGTEVDNSQYIDLYPGKTTLLYSDTLKLYLCHSGETVTIQKKQIRVGREKDCDLRFDNSYIARDQATFFYEDQSWFLQDNLTTNGTYINNQKLQPMKKYRLYCNDVIGFANKAVEVVFDRTEPVADPAEATDKTMIAILETAMKDFSNSGFNNDPALKLILAALLKAPLYFPVEIDIAAMLGSLDPAKLKAGDTIQPQDDVKMRILTLNAPDGAEIIPMFTSSEKAQKHQSVSTIRHYPQDYIATLLQMNKTVIINPFDEARFIMTPAFLKDILVPLLEKASEQPAVPDSVPQPVSVGVETDGLENSLIHGKYRILKQIGGVNPVGIYLAMNEQTNQVCAIKACKKTDRSRIIRECLLNEALTLTKLNHPAIPKIYDILEDNNFTYIILEYIQGETLDAILKREGAQPAARVIDWAKQLCDVLRYLHNLNPPHIYRDMKPSNVMLQPDGRVRLIDFGIMRRYDKNKDWDTTVLGTKGYAPPEQYGGAGQTDARADIFALGMTMHHLVTGVNPTKPPYITLPIRQIKPALPIQLEMIIQKCIEPSREKRYQTAESLLRALNGEPEPGKKKDLFSKLFGKH